MWENSKIFNVTSKYFSLFNNKLPASWARHITKDFLTCYFCSYYSLVIKTKLRSSCDKYYNKRIPYKYKKIIKQFSMNENIIILKQNKGRGVAIMNRSKYLEQLLSIPQGEKLMKLDYDPTSKLKSRVQRTLHKIKSKLPRNILYHTRKLYHIG